MQSRSIDRMALTRGQLAALAVVYVLTCLAFILIDRRGMLDPLKRLVDPPMRAASSSFTTLSTTLQGLGHRLDGSREVRAENARLREEHDQLLAAESRAKELEHQNTQLRDLPSVAQRYPQYRLLPAAVTLRNPQNREKAILIDRGSDDGVVIGMPAISGEILVGLVTEVQPKTSKVTLVIDENMQLSVELRGVTGAIGILYGRWQQGQRLQVRYIARDTPIPPQAVIVTSDFTQRVPRGLIIGVVDKVVKTEQTDTLELSGVPVLNYDGLETVTIILTAQ
jgi:rod shape-determining protein MreC